MTIHNAGLSDSASKLEIQQFLLLRVVYLDLKEARDFRDSKEQKQFISQSYVDDARAILEKSEPLKLYYKAIESQTKTASLSMGAFTYVYSLQLASRTSKGSDLNVSIPKVDYIPIANRVKARERAQAKAKAAVSQTPSTPPQSTGMDKEDIFGEDDPAEASGSAPLVPEMERLHLYSPFSPASPLNTVTGEGMLAVEDEETVNACLIAFLSIVLMHDEQVNGYWSHYRKAFWVSNTILPKDNKVFEARVDGVLRHQKTRAVKAIAEVKPYLRPQKKIRAIRMQESSQMAAWICTDPPKPQEFEGGKPVT